jgi:hypothetical protein
MASSPPSLLAFLFLFCSILFVVAQPASAAPLGNWETVANNQIAVKLGNPVRNRRSNDATVDISFTNTSKQTLTGPFRLVITGLNPSAKVSIANASGINAAGEPYFDLSGTVGDQLAPAAKGQTKVTITGGGPNSFSFKTRFSSCPDS